MQKSYKTKAIGLFIISLDSLLLLFFLVQSMTIGCLIAFGYVPIPTKLTNNYLLKNPSAGFHIQADSFRLKLFRGIELIGLKVYHSELKGPVLEARSTEVNYSFKKGNAYKFNLDNLVVTDGTLMMPAVYAPNGMRTVVLQDVTFHLSLLEDQIQINSFVAKHEDIYLRGSIDWPLKENRKQEKLSIRRFYQLLASAIKEKETFSPFIEPTLEFDLKTRPDDSIDVSLFLSCKQLEHSIITGNYFSFGTEFTLEDNTLIAKAPLLLHARKVKFADLDITAENITGQVKSERWPELFKGILPKFEISANRLVANKIELNAPRIKIEPSAFPILQFSGTTCGLKGSVAFSGALNSADKSGKINAHGSIDISNLLPDSLVGKLPELEFGSTPYYDLSVLFNKGFGIRNATFYVNFKDLSANNLRFNNIIAKGYFRKNILNFEDIHINRKKQWVNAAYYWDMQTQDFRIFLDGSVLPKQYNSLLPHWWSLIFKDLNLDQKNPGNGDFAIYGNMQENNNISLFGKAEVNRFKYKEAFFDSCEAIVRGRQNYFEIHNINARVGDGQGTGMLGFTSAIKPKTGLTSVRYRFDAQLPIEVASKSLGGNIADILGNFELTELPHVQVEGAYFNEKFKEYAGKNFVNLQAKVAAPLEFKETPLDYLNFMLFARGGNIYLRDVRFGYADGTANAIIDILPAEESEQQMCFKLNLKDANQAKAIQNLPAANNDESNSASTKDSDLDAARMYGLVDLNLHAKGPLTNPYGFEGYGNLKVRNEALGSIQLLGALSELLKNTFLNFTSFNLNRMDAVFTIDQEQLLISDLKINGPRTRILANGTFQLPNQALDMEVSVNLFANVGKSDSAIKAAGRFLTSPLPNLLSFKLTGTVDDQKIRSRFDPRNLIP